MDIIVFSVMLAVALILLAIDYFKKVPYMGVIGAVILILLGIFLATDGVLTTLVCA